MILTTVAAKRCHCHAIRSGRDCCCLEVLCLLKLFIYFFFLFCCMLNTQDYIEADFVSSFVFNGVCMVNKNQL